MSEEKMTAEEALTYLIDQHMDALDIGRGYECVEIIRKELQELRAELNSANETIEQERSLRSDVIAQRDAFREQNKSIRAQVTSEADGWCAESPEGELQKQLYSSNEDMGWSSLVGINSRSPEPYLVVQATRKLVADGWRVVPVKIVKVEG